MPCLIAAVGRGGMYHETTRAIFGDERERISANLRDQREENAADQHEAR